MGLADRDYMRECYRDRISQGYSADQVRVVRAEKRSVWSVIGLCLTVCSFGFAAYRAFDSPDLRFQLARDGPAVRFPDSGTVTVSPLATLPGPKSTFGVEVPPDNQDNYVVRLDRPEDGAMVMSIFARSGDSVRVPVPAGSYKVSFTHGRTWHGPHRVFGHATQTEHVVSLMTAVPQLGAGIRFSPGDLLSVDSSSTKFGFDGGHPHRLPHEAED